MSDFSQSPVTAPSQSSQTVHVILLAGLLGVSALQYAIADAANILGLVVANTILSNSFVWNLVTASFFELNLFKLVADLVILFYIFKTVNYHSVEMFASYLAITMLSCTILTSTYCILTYFVTADPALIVSPMYGFGGVLVAILMYARQFKGQESITGNGFPFHISFQALPVLLTSVEFVSWAVGFGKYTKDLPFVVICLFISWSYLRFYARGPTGEVGNHSESFTFASMFPERLHIVLIPFFTAFYNIAAIIGLYPKLAEAEKRLPHHLRFDNAGPGAIGHQGSPSVNGASGGAGGAKSASDIASERRRAKALKLLDAKMAELSSKDNDESWGDDDADQSK